MAKVDANKKIEVTQGFVDKLLDKISGILKEQYLLKEVDEEQAEEIELLLDRIGSIERNLEELTKSLAKGSYPLKLARSIKVSPASPKPDIVPVAIAKSQLIATYNEVPNILSGYINPVSLTPDSYRGKNSNGIILETTVKGNYWAICTQENKQYKYWLVPNNNISFNIHKIKTLENLFQLKGSSDSPNADFILEEPAILSLLPDNRQWKLIQPGVLSFGSNLKSKSPQTEKLVTIDNTKQTKINEQTLSSLNSFQKTIELLTNKVTQLEIQSEIYQKTHQRDKQEYELQEASLYKLTDDRKYSKINIDREDIDLKNQISQFRQTYIKNRKFINDLMIAKVAISVETLEQITFHKPDKIILENTPHGKYWIISYCKNYFLIPDEIEQITNAQETSLAVAKLLFHLSGYYPEYSVHHLIRPAIVTKISTNQWQLKEKGKFNFS